MYSVFSVKKIELLQELARVSYALLCTLILTFGIVNIVYEIKKNHRYVFWIWSSFPYLGILPNFPTYGQKKFKVIKYHCFIYHSMQNFMLIKLYKRCLCLKWILQVLLAVKVTEFRWNPGVNIYVIYKSILKIRGIKVAISV